MPFCGKCGTEYEEGGTCPVCAAETEPVVSDAGADTGSDKKEKKAKKDKKAKVIEQPEQTQGAAPKKKGKAKVILVLILIAILAIMAVAAVIVYQAPLKPINKVMDSFNKKESYLEYALSSYPKEWQKHVAKFDDIYEDRYDGDMDSMEGMLENLDDTYPNWKLSFERTSAIASMDAAEIEEAEAVLKSHFGYRAQMLRDYEESDYDNVADAYDLSDREASKFIQSMLDIYDDYEACEITKGYIVKGRYIFTYKEGNYESGEVKELKSDRAKFYMVQVNGDWIIVDVEYDSRPFEGENVWNANYSIPMQLYQTVYSMSLNEIG